MFHMQIIVLCGGNCGHLNPWPTSELEAWNLRHAHHVLHQLILLWLNTKNLRIVHENKPNLAHL